MTPSRDLVQGSRILRWMVQRAARGRVLAGHCSAWAARQRWISECVSTWRARPLRSAGVVVASGLCVNTVFWWSNHAPSVGDLIGRVGLLCWALATLKSTSSWDVIKRGSWLLSVPERRR